MASKVVLCVLLLAVFSCALAKPGKSGGKGKGSHAKSKKYKTKPIPEVFPPANVCDGVVCGVGRTCIVTEEQEPTCQCVQSCPAHDHQVCGSDGVTYPNKCELHRTSCMQVKKITQVKVGPCDPNPTPAQSRPSPLVCFQKDRDVLQHHLVSWIQSNEMADGWFMKGKGYLDVVDEYFKMFDESHDEVLDAREFMQFVEHNDTVRNSTESEENTDGDNVLMRSMCIDALLAEADADYDWALNLKEFEACLRPDFEPATKMCSLEGRTYADGDEMQNRCNECVCACGNWVCTANACDGDMVAGTEQQEQYDPAEENAMNEKEWKAIMKKLAKITPDEFPAHVRDLKHLEDSINAPTAVDEMMEEIVMEEAEEEEMEQMAEEYGLDIEEIEQLEEAVVPLVPIVPAQIDEAVVPVEVEDQIRERGQDIMERIRGGKRGGGKAAGKRNWGKRHHKSGGRTKN